MKFPRCLSGLAALVVCATAFGAAAQPQPEGVLTLTRAPRQKESKDMMSVVLAATREGTDAASVQSSLRQALDAALIEARKAARPGQT